jgi:hypothetical protein
MDNGYSANDASFFQLHDSLCELVNGWLLIHYPKSMLNRPKIPVIKRQVVDISRLSYIGFQNIRRIDSREPHIKTVGFFLKDYKFVRVCYRPWQFVDRLKQYKQVLSPDISVFTDMQYDEQMINVYWNRLTGAYWQYCGLTVIPTLS